MKSMVLFDLGRACDRDEPRVRRVASGDCECLHTGGEICRRRVNQTSKCDLCWDRIPDERRNFELACLQRLPRMILFDSSSAFSRKDEFVNKQS